MVSVFYHFQNKKRKTIGDCYVAVTGVPKFQKDHAVIMCKFASNMLMKMRIIRATLADRLGPDTRDLDLRIGIHSGSVTAGILRGQKSRFQLFGDTVNTAARMESTGQPGRVHVSISVAHELMDKGKVHWLEIRPDPVMAKGKGQLQTFWVNIGASPSQTTSRSITELLSQLDEYNDNEEVSLENLQEKLRYRHSFQASAPEPSPV